MVKIALSIIDKNDEMMVVTVLKRLFPRVRAAQFHKAIHRLRFTAFILHAGERLRRSRRFRESHHHRPTWSFLVAVPASGERQRDDRQDHGPHLNGSLDEAS
jgi:hypothetical protein